MIFAACGTLRYLESGRGPICLVERAEVRGHLGFLLIIWTLRNEEEEEAEAATLR